MADGKEQRPQEPSDKEGNWQVKGKKRKKPKKAQQTKESAEKGKVASKPGRHRRRFRKRKEAFQIIPAAGKTYEETLLELKKSVNLKKSGTRVHWIRKIQKGSVLIELEAIEDRQKL